MNKWVSGGELARLKGKTPQWINRKLKESGVQKRGGKFNCQEAIEYLDNNTDLEKNPNVSGVIPELRLWKIRKETAITKLKEMEVAERAGQLVSKDMVYKTVFACARQARDAMLAIPARISGMIAVETDQRTIQTLLQKEIEEGLRVCEKVQL